MNNILSKFLKKKGIEKIEDLSPEERTDFDRYEKVLSKEKVEVEDLKIFCKAQIKNIETKWADLGAENKDRLIPYHVVYSKILEVLEAPMQERSNLEKYLTQIIES